MTTARHSDTENSPDHLQRKLSNRHLQLIAIGGAIELAYLWVQVKPSPSQVLQFSLFI